MSGRYCREYTQEIIIGGRNKLDTEPLADNQTVTGK